MKWPFPVGTKVKINKEGFTRYPKGPCNPEGVVGVVERIDRPDRPDTWITVRWSKGLWNAYAPGTLDLARPIQLENK